MAGLLKIVLIEDNAGDAELLMHALDRAGFVTQVVRVETEAALRAALEQRVDIVLADYELPGFSGLRALSVVKERQPDVPFIIVSGVIGEDTAVATMKLGAWDYLLKDRLGRLEVAISQALTQARLRRERREAELQLRESAASMAAAQEVGNFGSWELILEPFVDPAVSPLRWSAQCYRIFGFAPAEVEVTSELFFSLVHPEDVESVRAAMAVALEKRQRYFIEHRIVIRSGEVRHVREAGRVFVRAGTDQPFKLVGTVHDVTEEKRAEAALRQSEELYRKLVTASPDAIVVTAQDGTLSYVSEQARRLFGYGRIEEAQGRNAMDSVAPQDRARAQHNFARLETEGRIGVNEYLLLRQDGSTFQGEINSTLLTDNDGKPAGMLLIARDITERTRAQAALRDSEERFRQVVETIREVFWMSDVRSNEILYVSPGYEDIWGRPCAELYAAHEPWLDSVHPDDLEWVARAVETKQLDGTYDETYRIVRPDGSLRWVRDRAFPLKDASGAITRIVGVAEDITERKKLEEQFLRGQRLEAIGTLSSGIAHDLNNILAPMLMVAPLLKEKLADPEDVELLMMVEHGAQRGANIIKQLLTFSRGVDSERGIVQPRHLLREMAAMMRETFPREIEVEERFPVDLWPVFADATQIHQVLMNLCVNARDAMRHGGRITLDATNLLLDERDVASHPDAKAGRYVCIIVSDTGEGIPRENLDRIFEPFFTTKDIGKGTGLGLSTVLGIVKSHGGFVKVYSEPGRGSAFQVHLPAIVDAAETAVASVQPPRLGRQETILVVDDEDAIRHTLTVILEKNNYRVLSAPNGRDAITLFLSHRDEVQLVLTDIMMPGMNGVTLIKTLRSFSPRIHVVAASGLHDQDRRDELALLGVTQVLAKPCSREELLKAVERELGAG